MSPWWLTLLACAPEPAPMERSEIVAVSFNTGTTLGLNHDAAPDDGYTSEEAEISDAHYGDGLAFLPVVEEARAFFDAITPDIVAFQEIFWSGDCASIPAEFHEGFVCEGWKTGDPTVAQRILGPDYQVACHQGKPDKCLAVHRDFGLFSGCEADICLDHLDGAQVDGCGSGSRVGRGRITLADGGELTVVNAHGSSGLTPDDRDCRVRQVAQVFDDLDGQPAANGERNLVLGDWNTDPGRNGDFDPSAEALASAVDRGFAFHTQMGPDATPTYAGLFNIDHVLSDAFEGGCAHAGIDGLAAVSEAVYFDHMPAVCTLYSP